MRESQHKMIIDALSTGQRVTVRQLATKPIYSMYGGKRLSELKEKGYDIRDHWVEAENGKRYKEYFFPKSEINRLKKGKKKMSIDEYSGMIKAYKNVKDYCDQLSKIAKDKSVVTQTMNTILDSIQKYCDSSITIVEENIDGEIERMYEMMEGKKDDRQDHRDV